MMRTTVAATLLFGLVASSCSESSIDVTAPSDTKCSVSVRNARTSFGPDGGSGQLSVTTSRECTWSVAAGAEWITLGGPTSGQGDAVVRYSIADNAEPAPRQGAIEVSGELIQIRQEGAPETPEPPSEPDPPNPAPPEPEPPAPEPPTPAPPEPEPPTPGPEPPPGCSYAIDPTSRAVAAAGGSVSVAVRTDAGCSWTATSRAGWITIVEGWSGSGSGTATLAVAANRGEARTGAVNVANRTFTVRQEAAPQQPPEPEPPPPSPEPPPPTPEPKPPPKPEPKPPPKPEPPPKPKPPQCSYQISPATHSAALLGGTGTVNVITSGGCRWKATSNADWITILGESSGTGSAVITFRVAINLSLASRTGTLTIAGRTFTVNQSVL
jgi:outer membrane biosynthesis protein TonB